MLGKSLGEVLAQGWDRLRPPGDVIVPVPLDAGLLRERGDNQSGLLARELARRTGLLVIEDALTRTRETLPQVGLGAGQRWENVQGAFNADAGDRVRRKAVLIVDDVCTTGATLIACAEALRVSIGRTLVWALTLARSC